MLGTMMIWCYVGWDDVGDFSSLADLLPAEANQPRILGNSTLGIHFSHFRCQHY